MNTYNTSEQFDLLCLVLGYDRANQEIQKIIDTVEIKKKLAPREREDREYEFNLLFKQAAKRTAFTYKGIVVDNTWPIEALVALAPIAFACGEIHGRYTSPSMKDLTL